MVNKTNDNIICNFSIIPPSTISTSIAESQMSSTTGIVPPVITVTSTSSGALRHNNSTRKKGRFRVRRVSKTPEGIKQNLRREVSSSPVKSVSITTNHICEDIVQLRYMPRSTGRKENHGNLVVIYNIAKLFANCYDIDLASKYILDELGKSVGFTLFVRQSLIILRKLTNNIYF